MPGNLGPMGFAVKFFKRNSRPESQDMPTHVTDTETINLSDRRTLTPSEIDQHKKEIRQIERKLEGLNARHGQLTSDLEDGTTLAATSEAAALDSEKFLDETTDAFETASSPNPALDFDVADAEFDERFATFAANDDQGDDRARRWFGSAL